MNMQWVNAADSVQIRSHSIVTSFSCMRGWDKPCNSMLAVLLSCSRVSEQLYIWRTRQPSQTMHMRTATVLSLKPQLVVLCTKVIQVKALEELLESLIEKPVSYSWVVNDCTSAGTCILWTILADQVCKLWPLKVSSTVSEEDSRKSKSVNHGYQAATLFHPVGSVPLREPA